MNADYSPLERKTKIVATVGPASRSKESIAALLKAGVNVFRLNFSHGTHDEHLAVLETIRSTSKELKIHVAVLQDLSGPKIRITEVNDDYETITDDHTIKLYCAAKTRKKSNGNEIYVETVDPVEILEPGERILMADGIITLESEEVHEDHVVCRIIKGGRIRSRVGIAFPDSEVNLPATTEKDMVDLQWGIKHKVEFVALSFVLNAADIEKVRASVVEAGADCKIIAKIERKQALENISEILDVSDGLMVARGDLGLELPLEKLPLIQKDLIEEANFRGIPAIVATQMLHSMITSNRPTRAEVSDIAAAVMSGADAVMLSEETAIGEHPPEAVAYLGRIAAEAEKSFEFDEYKLRLRMSDHATVPDAVAYAAAAAAVKIGAAAVVACTETGNSARLLAKYRPQQALFGASSSDSTLNRMCLYWGVIPVHLREPDNHQGELDSALEVVQRAGGFADDDKAVITGGLTVRTPGATSVLEIKPMKTP